MQHNQSNFLLMCLLRKVMKRSITCASSWCYSGYGRSKYV